MQIVQLIQIIQIWGDFVAFRFSGKQDVYIEIAEKYKEYILNGIYKYGDKLPSVRYVALELNVNPNTVARAFSLLEKWGYINSISKKGAFVIYNGESTNCNETVFKAVLDLKNGGVTYDELLNALKEVYKNDWN